MADCGRQAALLLEKRNDVLQVSGLISVCDGIGTREYPG